MDGTGESAAQRVTDLRAQLTAAEADAAGGAVERPVDPQAGIAPTGAATATAEGTGAIQAAPADAAAPQHKSVLELLAETRQSAIDAGEGKSSPHSFIENLRVVADRLEADGRLVMTDMLGAGEAPKITATLAKVVGELVSKL